VRQAADRGGALEPPGSSGGLPGTVAAVGHVLTTERLVLRPVTAHDHAWLLNHHSGALPTPVPLG
jgi:hypothetical protein